MPTTTVIALAEAIFVFTDELASDVVEGYVRRGSPTRRGNGSAAAAG